MTKRTIAPVPGLKIYEDFVPQEWHDKFVKEMEIGMPEKNLGHYDGFEFPDNDVFDAMFVPMMMFLFKKMKKMRLYRRPGDPPKALGCSIVGYEPDGFIPRHIDSPQLSKDTVVVFSFLSRTLIHFYEEGTNHEELFLIKPCSMYIMAGESRYKWSHEIKPEEESYNGKKVRRGKRYSILLFEPGKLYQGPLMNY